MAKRRRKNRTHLNGAAKGETEVSEAPFARYLCLNHLQENVPKSFVIKVSLVVPGT